MYIRVHIISYYTYTYFTYTHYTYTHIHTRLGKISIRLRVLHGYFLDDPLANSRSLRGKSPGKSFKEIPKNRRL